MIKYSLLISLLLLSYFTANAQTSISGKISDKQNKPIDNVIVSVLNPSTGGILTFCYSDKSGIYNAKFNTNLDSVAVVISALMVARQVKTVENRSQEVNFTASEEQLKINEVVVKSTPIRQKDDTLVYNVGSFIDTNDRVIGDVIKKLPGVTVETSGVIKYQGKEINKFYIENMDLLQGRYNIATKNISAQDISKIEIMENHQPIKAMKGIRETDAAAMNLKLKEGIKGAFMLTTELGGGAIIDKNNIKGLWDATLNGMIFSRKMQNMTLYKTNNTGNNIYNDLRSFTTASYSGSDNITGITMPSPPQINENRYLFNNTHAVSTNQLFRNKNQDDITFNILYLNDKLDRNSYSNTTIFLPENQQTVINENISSQEQINRIEANMRYESNKNQRYINNNLTLSKQWSSNYGNITTDKEINQELSSPTLNIAQSLYTIKNIDGKGYELKTGAGFKSSPQSLTVYDGLYPDIFNNGDDYKAIRQNINSRSAYVNANGSLLSLFKIGEISVDPTLNLGFNYNELSSDIYKSSNDANFSMIEDDAFRNKLYYYKLNANIGINLRYRYKDLAINIGIPLSYNLIATRDRVTKNNYNRNYLWLQPNANISYQFNNNIKWNFNYGLNNTTGTILSLYSGSILTSYRSINRFDDLLPTTRSNYINSALEYKSIIHMLFANINYSYYTTKNDMITEQYYDGALSLTSRLPLENIHNGQNIKGSISKGFDFAKSKIGIEVSYGTYNSEQFRQGEKLQLHNNSLNIGGNLNFIVAKFLSIYYKGNWNQTNSKIDDATSLTPIKTMTNEVGADINITKNIYISAAYESYYNSASLGAKRMDFGDIGINFKIKSIDLWLKCNNLFNNNKYEIARYSSLDQYRYSYQIRPRTLLIGAKFKII